MNKYNFNVSFEVTNFSVLLKMYFFIYNTDFVILLLYFSRKDFSELDFIRFY